MWLKILSGELKGEVIPLDSARLKIGRAKENEVSLPDTEVSALHAHLYSNHNGQWFMKSTGLENPLYVGKVKHNSTFNLEPGMVVKIGNTLVQFQVSSDQNKQPVANRRHPPPIIKEPTSRRILPILLGAGVGILILGIVLLLVNNDMLGLSEAQVAATNTQIALANATATPTVTQTPSPTATATPTVTPSPTATAEPTPTPVPLLEPQLGEITQEPYSPDLLDPNLLENVKWDHSVLFTVSIFLTNRDVEAIRYEDIDVGLFANPLGELMQVPSFFLSSNDGVDTIEPNERRMLRWQIVLPDGVSLDAWKVIYNDFEVQGFLNP